MCANQSTPSIEASKNQMPQMAIFLDPKTMFHNLPMLQSFIGSFQESFKIIAMNDSQMLSKLCNWRRQKKKDGDVLVILLSDHEMCWGGGMN